MLNPGGLLGVIGVTVANGADNIAVYTPLFRALPTADTILTLVVFVVLIGVWLLAGRLIVSHPRVVLKIANIEGWLVPHRVLHPRACHPRQVRRPPMVNRPGLDVR